MGNFIKLCELPIGQSAKIKRIDIEDSMKRRLLDLGLVKDTKIKAVCKSPSGDPKAFEVRGAVIALREDVSSVISVEH